MPVYLLDMLNKTNVDVQIYLHKLMEGINQVGLIEAIKEEWEIEDEEKYREMLEESLSLQASLNFEENGDPIIAQNQLEDALVRCAIEYTVEDLTEKGILEKNLEEGGTENVYSIKAIDSPEEPKDEVK